MNTSPIISIIVPIYNKGNYLKECIDSILNQSFKDFELILVDDGSNDQSGTICKSYLNIDKRVSYYFQENSGQNKAREFGYKRSVGQYISFIDADDIIPNNYFEILLKNASPKTISVVRFKTDCSDLKKEKAKVETIKDKIVLNKFFKSIFFISLWGKLFPRDFFNNINFINCPIHEDFFVTYQIFSQAHDVKISNESYYYYLNRGNSQSKRKYSLDYLSVNANLKNIYLDMKSKNMRRKYFDAFKYRQLRILLVFYANTYDSPILELRKEANRIKVQLKKEYFKYLFSNVGLLNKIALTVFAFSQHLFMSIFDRKNKKSISKSS